MKSASDRKTIRNRMIKKRLELTPALQAELNNRIQKILLDLWKPEWNPVLMYLNQPDEVETIPIIKSKMAEGLTVTVPSHDANLKVYRPSKLEHFERDLEAGMFGILEPKKPEIRPVDIESIKAIFLPGIAFDPSGNRLGYGYGFFDEMCRNTKALKIGLAYHFQILDSIEAHAGDVPMDAIITEKGWISC